jgi:hypothetical protein
MDIGNRVGTGPPVGLGLNVAVGVSDGSGESVTVGVELGVYVDVPVGLGVALKKGVRVRTGLRVTRRTRVRAWAGVGPAGTTVVGISPAEQAAKTTISKKASAQETIFSFIARLILDTCRRMRWCAALPG